jgi:PhoD-like phosphatase, N-terminal domain/BNR repeat-containing family member
MSRWTRRGTHALAISAILAVVVAMVTRPGPPTRLSTVVPTVDPVVLNDNGGWSWFEDERAVVDPATGTLLVSSVANASGTGGAARDGNVEVVAYDIAARTATRSVLHAGLEGDDHDSAALYVRPDGRYFAMYARHGTARFSWWRVSRRPGDARQWEPKHTIDHEVGTTYSNVYPASVGQEKLLYGFVRSAGRDPNLLLSRDHGSTWSRGGRLLEGPGAPYVRYAVDGLGRIHLITTEQHPTAFANGIYYGVIEDGRLLRSDGTILDRDLADDEAVAPERLTEVFDGASTRRAWTVDLQVDAAGRPYATFSAHYGPSDNRYYYARFDGATWRVNFLAHAGSALYPAESYYTGLVALDPHDPGRVFVSTDVDPVTRVPLISDRDQRQHHELFEGVTNDGGITWAWTALTANSTVDNIRPVVPIWDAKDIALLWLRGTYTSYQDYDLDVVGSVTKRVPTSDRLRDECDSADDDLMPVDPPQIPLFPPAQKGCQVSLRRRRRPGSERPSPTPVVGSPPISRRRLVVGLGVTGAIALTSAGCGTGVLPPPVPARPRRRDPFTLGVASGEPRPDGIVLWTRLAPDPLTGGGMPDRPVPVEFQVAVDQTFRKVVATGSILARPELGHSVHPEVSGLSPGSWYWYRFRADGHLSPAVAPAPRRWPARPPPRWRSP